VVSTTPPGAVYRRLKKISEEIFRTLRRGVEAADLGG
jgi:hypothetical protein